MKTWQTIGIIFGASYLFTLIFLVIKLVTGGTWWWFGIPIIVVTIAFIGTIFVSIGFLIANRQEARYEEDPKEMKERIIKEMKEDQNNPDNFIITNQDGEISHTGRDGQPPTPIVVFKGYGSETREVRIVLVNQTNPQKKTTLINPSKDEIEKAITKLADYPTEFIPEERIRSDSFGNVVERLKTQRPLTYAEAKKEEEKQKEEVQL